MPREAQAALPVALDAMGGDNAPGEVVRGAVRAVREAGIAVTLVGRQEEIHASLRAAGAEADERLRVVDARDVIGMTEHPANAVRSKRDSSIVRACALVADGSAAAAVSAGNSGAMLAAGLFTVGRISGVSRPAIGAAFPTAAGQTFMLDVGANTDCRPEWLAQFAVMGDVYARSMMGVERPRVALLSNGEEEEKGSELVQAARPLLAALPLQFVGNVEGKGVFTGHADVVVTDGFTGNIALKTAEGVGEFLFGALREAARTSVGASLGGALLKPKLRPLRDRIDYRKTGGALLLGVRGEIVIAHGRSDAEAILNALKVGARAAERDVSGVIGRSFQAGELAAPAAPDAGDAGGAETGAAIPEEPVRAVDSAGASR